MIPPIDLVSQHRALQAEINAGIQSVMASGRFLFGPNVTAFEKEAAAYLQVPHTVCCGSGSAALLLALRVLDIGPGDEVITTPFTFFATVEAILHCGAQPVFVDIDPHSLTLDSALVEAAISPRTRALLPVHIFGQPAAMPALTAIAEQYSLSVVEDCAQAFGARINGRACGQWGTLGCFSFFPSKNLGACGDGGMLSTHSADLAQRLRELCNHGCSERYYHRRAGFNSRLDELQAVILRAKLGRIEAYNQARRRIAGLYRERLQDLPGLILPQELPGQHAVYNYYTVQLPQRNRIYRHLQEQEIGCSIHYPRPLHHQPALAAFRRQPLPVAEKLARRCLSLPMYPELTDLQVTRVARALRQAMQ